MKFIYTGEVEVATGKLDQFIEFANRFGVKGVEQNENVPGQKKRRKKGRSLGSKSGRWENVQVNVQRAAAADEVEVLGEDPVSICKEAEDEDFKKENIEEKVDDVVNKDVELVEEDDHDEDIDMANLEAEDDDDLVDEAVEEEEEEVEEQQSGKKNGGMRRKEEVQVIYFKVWIGCNVWKLVVKWRKIPIQHVAS